MKGVPKYRRGRIALRHVICNIVKCLHEQKMCRCGIYREEHNLSGTIMTIVTSVI
jgi:hypothetical protein